MSQRHPQGRPDYATSATVWFEGERWKTDDLRERYRHDHSASVVAHLCDAVDHAVNTYERAAATGAAMAGALDAVGVPEHVREAIRDSADALWVAAEDGVLARRDQFRAYDAETGWGGPQWTDKPDEEDQA